MPNRRFHGKRRFAVFGTFLLIFSSTVAEHYELTVCCSLHGQGLPFHGDDRRHLPHRKLEDKQSIISRIREAAKIVPLDRLYLSPQCGFASCEIGNKLTEEEQWAKIKLINDISEEVWGK